MRWACLLLLGGCDIVFGIEPTRIVTVDVVQRTLANDATGMPVAVDAPHDRAGIEVRVFDEAGNAITTRDEGATFVFAVDGPYRFIVTDPERVETTEYQGATDHMRIVRLAVNRPGFELGRETANLVVDLRSNPPPASGVMRIYTTGVFTLQIPSPPNELFNVPWKNLPLVETSQNDRLYAVHFSSQVLPGSENVVVTDGVFTPSIDMTAAGDSIAAGTYRALASDHCGRVVVPRRTELDRMIAIWERPAQVVVSQWQIGAWTPHGDGLGYLPLVGNNANAATAANGDFMVTYGDPFPHPERVALLTTQVYSTFLSRGVSISTGIESRVIVPLEANCAPTDLSPRVAIAEAITIGGIALVDDDQRIRIDRRASVPITFQLGEGELGAFAVRLYKVNPSAIVPLLPGLTFFTNQPRVQIDEQELDIGGTYTVLVYNMRGIERAGEGDFGLDGLASYTARFSRTFTIEN